jgi:hypothetical protein
LLWKIFIRWIVFEKLTPVTNSALKRMSKNTCLKNHVFKRKSKNTCVIKACLKKHVCI